MKINRLTQYSFFSLSAFMLLMLSACSTVGTNGQTNLNKAANHDMVFNCTPTQLFRCEPGEKTCMTIPVLKTQNNENIQTIIDLKNAYVKTITKKNNIVSESEISSIKSVEHLIYLHGRGIGIDKAYRSWNAIINRQDGQLYASSITTGAGHVIYGVCHE